MVLLPRIDLQKQADGVWHRHLRGYSIKARPKTAPDVRRAFTEEYRRRLAEARMTDPEREDLTPQEYKDVDWWVMAHHAITDWKDIDDPAHVPTDAEPTRALPYSPRVCYEVLRDPAYAEFETHAQMSCMSPDAYLADVTRAGAKN